MNNVSDKPSVGAILRALMRRHDDIGQNALARETGVPQPTIQRILDGTTQLPKVEVARPLARFFGVTLDQFYGDAPLPGDAPRRPAPKKVDVLADALRRMEPRRMNALLVALGLDVPKHKPAAPAESTDDEMSTDEAEAELQPKDRSYDKSHIKRSRKLPK